MSRKLVLYHIFAGGDVIADYWFVVESEDLDSDKLRKLEKDADNDCHNPLRTSQPILHGIFDLD